MTPARRDERGAVVVLVAVLLPLLVLLLAFVVDTGHWWTHQRHLQTQADAGALAGAFGPWFPVVTCDESAIEAAARQYAGAPAASPPYNSQYSNASNVHVLINSKLSWNEGGSDFSEGGTPCYALRHASKGNPGFLDVKVTESALPNLFASIPGFDTVTINREARVEIQRVIQENNVRPIAVRDNSEYQCAQIQLVRTDDESTLAVVNLPDRVYHPADPDVAGDISYTEFQNAAGYQMPELAHNMYVRAVLYESRDCTGPSDIYPEDDNSSPTGGLNFINVYSSEHSPSGGSPPVIRSVTVQNGSCAPDQYFSSRAGNPGMPEPCGVTVKAFVDWAPGAIKSGSDQNAFIWIKDEGTGAEYAAAAQSDGSWVASFSIASRSGPHRFTARWEQQYGTIGNKTCKPHGNPKACSGGFVGTQQQAYSATSDDTQPSSSNGLQRVHVDCTENCGPAGPNSYEEKAAPKLAFTLRLVGLTNSVPGDGTPATILRYDNQSSHRTGAVNCGWPSNGGKALSYYVQNGCPSPVHLWTEGDDCFSPVDFSPADFAQPPTINCVDNVPGNKDGTGIIDGLEARIGNSPNNWLPGHTIPPDDPRLITMIITGPTDLNGTNPKSGIPVLNLAQFYVTGLDRFNGNGDEPFPGNPNAKQSIRNAAVWGYFVQYVPLDAVGSGEACIPNTFGDCAAVLTK